MPDREKVIEGLEKLRKDLGYGLPDRSDVVMEYLNSLTDAIALLKEQEAVEPIKMQRMDSNFSFFVPYYLCGNCRYELVGKDVMFCSHCGRAVKWNECKRSD